MNICGDFEGESRMQPLKFLAGIYLLKVNSGNIRTRCEICSKLTIKTRWTYFTPCSSVSIVNFEQVNTSWFSFSFRCLTVCCWTICDLLTHYILVLFFYTPWKHQKTFTFSDVFKVIENDSVLPPQKKENIY